MVGFAGDQVEIGGYVELRTTFSNDIAARTIIIRYIVVNASFTYNLFFRVTFLEQIGCGGLNDPYENEVVFF